MHLHHQIDVESLEKKFKHSGGDFYVHKPYVISDPSKMSVGKCVRLGSYLQIWSDGGIEIGNDVIIASHTSITSMTHDTKTSKYNEKNIASPVKIGNNVWIGSHVIILPGVTIGNNCVIGAGSVVNKSIPDNSTAVGVPAKVVKIN